MFSEMLVGFEAHKAAGLIQFRWRKRENTKEKREKNGGQHDEQGVHEEVRGEGREARDGGPGSGTSGQRHLQDRAVQEADAGLNRT